MDGGAVNLASKGEASRERADEALRRVLTEHGASLRRLAGSWTRTASEQDDLLQEIALALLTALPTFRGDCPERAFALRVAHNCALRFAAERRRAGDHDELEAHDPPSLAVAPDEQLDRRRRVELLHRALRSLREEQRVVVVLSLEGLSHEEIAAVVGGTANAVGVRLHRARAALLQAHRRLEADPGATHE